MAGSSYAPTGRRRSRPNEQIIAGNVIAYGATSRPDLHPRRRGRAVLRPQLRRAGRHRGRRRPRLRVHDRRPGRRPGQDRPQLRGRHVRRRRLGARPRRAAGSTRSWSSSARSRARRPRSSRSWCATHVEETGSTVAEELLADWDGRAGPLHRGDADRLPRGARGEGQGRGRRPRRERDRQRDDGGAPWLTPARRSDGSWRRGSVMADPKGFLKNGREVADRRPVEERVQDWNEVYPGGVGPRAAADHHRAGRPLHGLRHPVLPPGLPARATSSRSGTTWSGATTGRARSSGCTRPTTSRSSPAGSARRRARPPACWASTRTR